MFEAWINFLKKINISSSEDFLKEPIWHNVNVKVGGISVSYKVWTQQNIFFIYDLVDENGDFYDYLTFVNKFRIKTSFLEFQGLIKAIKLWKS